MNYEDYAKLRDYYNLTDAEIAKRAQIGRSTFSDWKNGRSMPKENKLHKIADAIGLDYVLFINSGEAAPEDTTISVNTYGLDKVKADAVLRAYAAMPERLQAYVYGLMRECGGED